MFSCMWMSFSVWFLEERRGHLTSKVLEDIISILLSLVCILKTNDFDARLARQHCTSLPSTEIEK